MRQIAKSADPGTETLWTFSKPFWENDTLKVTSGRMTSYYFLVNAANILRNVIFVYILLYKFVAASEVLFIPFTNSHVPSDPPPLAPSPSLPLPI